MERGFFDRFLWRKHRDRDRGGVHESPAGNGSRVGGGGRWDIGGLGDSFREGGAAA